MAIGIGILGAGRWGSHLIRKFLADPRAQVRAIADPSVAMLERVQQHMTLPTDVQLTSDWQELLRLPGLDALVVATPAVTHYPVVSAAFQRGLSVLVEKPLTLTPEESYGLCHQAQTQGCVLVVDHTYLFNPAVEAARGVIQSGALGELRYGYASRTHLCPVRQDVDALWDLAIHDIAIFNHWLGERPVQVQAQGSTWLQPHLQTPLSPRGLADTVWAQLAYPGGVPVQMHFSWLNPDKQRRIGLVGDRGTLIFDELAPNPLVLLQGHLDEENGGYNPGGLAQEVISIPAGEPLQRVCAHFLDCVIAQQGSERSSGWVGAQLVEVLTALSQSMVAGHPVGL